MASGPLLDRQFLEKLERLTIHWQKSFAGLVGGHNSSRFAGRRPGVSRPSPFPPRRRSARGQLARLSAAGKAVPENVPGGAARAGAHAAGYQRFHEFRRAPSNSITRASWRRRSATWAWCGWIPSRSSPSVRAWARDIQCGGGRHRFSPVMEYLSRLKAHGRTDYLEVVRQFISTHPQRGLLIIISDFLDDNGLRKAAAVSGRFRPRAAAGSGLGRRRPHAAVGWEIWIWWTPRPKRGCSCNSTTPRAPRTPAPSTHMQAVCSRLAAPQRGPVRGHLHRHDDRRHYLRLPGALAGDCLNVFPQSFARAVPGACSGQSPPPWCCSTCWGARGASRWLPPCGSGWRRSSPPLCTGARKFSSRFRSFCNLSACCCCCWRSRNCGWAHRSPRRAITC